MKIVKPDPITTTGYVTRTGTATYNVPSCSYWVRLYYLHIAPVYS